MSIRRRGSDETSPGTEPSSAGAEGRVPAQAPGSPPPLGDHWFRPEAPAGETGAPDGPGGADGRRYQGPGKAKEARAARKAAEKDAAKAQKAAGKANGKSGGRANGRAGRTAKGVPAPLTAEDHPTESFTPPSGWLDEAATGPIPRVSAAGAAAGAAGGAAPPVDGTGAVALLDPPDPTAKKTKKPKKKRHLFRKFLWFVLFCITAVFVVVFIAYSKIEIPDAANANATRQTSRVYYAGGQEEIGRFGDINRNSVTLDKVPMDLRNAVLAAENRSFYSDNGVSPKGMLRALWVNLRGGSTQGGSTITQQYVKNYYLTQDRTVKRKLREALLSIKIDREKSKDQILQDYLNTIYMGRGAYGVQSAARAYFDKDVSRLTTGEAAVIASLIRSPGRYDPSEKAGLTNLKLRWSYVLNAMVETGTLTQQQRTAVKFPKFPEQIKAQSRYGGQKGYLLTAIRQELEARGLDKDDIENGGFKIVTTLDPQAQQSALDAVAKEFPTFKNKGLRVGLAAVQPGTGRILAMYGGKDFLGKGKYAQVNTATVPIQPGSGVKPFTLAAGLEANYRLSSGFNGNSPMSLPGSRPVSNEFGQDYGSSISLLRALEQSVNTAFVDLTMHVGASKVRKAFVRAGIPNDVPGLETNARITLGIASIRPTQMADAYATLCSGGYRAEQHMVEKVYAPNGGEVGIRKPEVTDRPVFSPYVVSEVIKAMRGVVQEGTGTEAKKLGRPAAGKTGTHEDLTAWFNGCTPQLAASVVYFKNDGTDSLDGSAGMDTFFGGTYPAKTWTTFMKGALRGQPVKQFPVVRNPGEKAAEPTFDPYGTSSGFDGVDPTIQPTEPADVTGPQFPVFNEGPSGFSPAPSPAPTAEPEPSAAPLPENCTNDPDDQSDPPKVYRPDCPSPAGGAPAAATQGEPAGDGPPPEQGIEGSGSDGTDGSGRPGGPEDPAANDGGNNPPSEASRPGAVRVPGPGAQPPA